MEITCFSMTFHCFFYEKCNYNLESGINFRAPWENNVNNNNKKKKKKNLSPQLSTDIKVA